MKREAELLIDMWDTLRIECHKVVTEENYDIIKKAINALEQEPCEDCVSRQAVTDAVENTIAKYIPIFIGRYEKIPLELAMAVKDLPPVIPQEPKTGHWTYDYELIKQLKECGLLADTWRHKDFLVYKKCAHEMTQEEAKGILEEIKINDDCLTQYVKGFDEALDIAIKALDTLEEFERAQIITGGRLNGRTYAYKCGLEDGKRKVIEQEPCEDAVSRKFMYELGATCIATRDKNGKLIPLGAIENLPPVTPIHKDSTVQDFDNKCRVCGATYGKQLKKLDRIKARYDEERQIILNSNLEYTPNAVLDIIDYIIHGD